MAIDPAPPTAPDVDGTPRSDRAGRADRSSGGLQSLVQAEKLMQIAFLLPSATLIGWGIGWWVDHHFQMHWATIAGLVFGMVAGMVSVIRMALGAGNTGSGKITR